MLHTAAEREVMYERVLDWAEHVSVAHATQVECDELGMSAAQKLAARRALEGLGVTVDHVVVDGNWDFVESVPTTMLVKGDAISLSIAAASIVAKVTHASHDDGLARILSGVLLRRQQGLLVPAPQGGAGWNRAFR